MAKYKYKCKLCNDTFVIECKMTEYQSKQPCKVCGELSDRDTGDLIPQNYVVKCQGFYGKES